MLDLAADASRFLGEFSESVTYHPAGGGPDRAVVAVVDRQLPQPVDEVPGTSRPLSYCVLVVANSAVTGIASTELNTGGDEISVPARQGGAAVRRRIASLIDQDAGLLTLEVQ